MIPWHYVYYQLARWYLIVRQPGRAALAYRAALKAKPDYALAAASLGFLYATKQEYAEAAEAFRTALAIDPENADVWFDLGYVYQQQRDYPNALSSFQRAIALRASLDRAWFGIGLVHAAQAAHREAIPAFEQAAKLQPWNPHALYELARSHYALHNAQAVRKILKKLSNFDPEVTKQLIRETGLLPEGVEPRQETVRR